MKTDYRHLAKQAFARAKQELDTADNLRLCYAALEMRKALEALVYSRVEAYSDLIPPHARRTWQPRKLMSLLLQIDPAIGMTSTSYVRLDEPDVPEADQPPMLPLGTDHVLSIESLRDHYDALGSYLHVPTIEQSASGKPQDLLKLRRRCEALVPIIETVTNSRIWNVTFANYSVLDECMNERCKQPIKKRLPMDVTSLDVTCFHCGANYFVRVTEEGTFWEPKQHPIKCSTDGCAGQLVIWQHEMLPGVSWQCRDCQAAYTLVLKVGRVDPTNPSPPSRL